MTIIEMCGLPGCGKTTLRKLLENELEEIGNSIKTEYSFHNTNKIKSALHIIRLLLFQYPIKLKVGLISFATRYNRKSLRYALRMIEDLDYIDRAKKNKADFFILDEGCIQHLTSIAYTDRLSVPVELCKELHNAFYSEKHLVLNCYLPFDEVLRRIRKRQKTGDRYLGSEDDKVKKQLEIKNENLELAINMVKPECIMKIEMFDTSQVSKDIILYLEEKEG